MNPNGTRAIQTNVSKLPVPVTSRLFVASDLAALYAIEEVCFEPQVRFSRSLMRSLAHGPENRTWLGIVNKLRVGFAMVGLRGEEDTSLAYIWTIEVLPAFRRMGVGRHLMERVEESARGAGCAAIALHVSERNTHALALYEANGYEHFGVETGFYGRGENAFRYRKTLT